MQKYIVNNDKLILGNVKNHKDLATDHLTTEGGGMYVISGDTVIMYGGSVQFGKVSNDRLHELILNRAYSEEFKGYLFKII